MKLKKMLAAAIAVALFVPALAMAKPPVHVVGTVKYDPAKTWNSFVVLSGSNSAKLIDRNGNLVKEWDLQGGNSFPAKVYPGGYLLTTIYGGWMPGYQDGSVVALLDFDSKPVRTFNKYQKSTEGGKGQPAEKDGSFMVSRQHHDYQLEGDPVGYYSPTGAKNVKMDGKMLVLAHKNTTNPKINSGLLLDDAILIVDKDQNILWEWLANEHFDELGLDQFPDAMERLGEEEHPFFWIQPGEHRGLDWFHINCASWLGPNKWYNELGDQRFHPENIIIDSRETGHMIIIDHKTGAIVWQVAPPGLGADSRIEDVITPHHTHMIPEGLPGAGNIMVFDNGGVSPYFPEKTRYSSRIVEFNPVTKHKVWEYSSNMLLPNKYNSWVMHGDEIFFSPFISSAQRLPNGNTLICEGSTSRIFEVTPELEIVWDYTSPYGYMPPFMGDVTYRAYAVPYDYVPQLPKPAEVAVTLPARNTVFMPNDKGEMAKVVPTVDAGAAKMFSNGIKTIAPVK